MQYSLGQKVIIKGTGKTGEINGFISKNDDVRLLVDGEPVEPGTIEPFDLQVGDVVAVVSPSPFQTFISAGYQFVIDKVGVDVVDFAGYEYHGKAVVKGSFSAAFHRQHVVFVSRPDVTVIDVDSAALAAINDRKSLVGHVNALKGRLHDARGDIKTLKAQLEGSTAGMANATAIIKRLQAAFNVFVQSAAEWDGKKAELERIAMDRGNIIEEQSKELADLHALALSADDLQHGRLKRIEQLESLAIARGDRLDERNKEIASLSAINDRQANEIGGLQSRINMVTSQRDKAASKIDELRDTLAERDKKIAAMSDELAGYRMQCFDPDADCKLQQEVDDLRKEIAYRDKQIADRGDTITRQANMIDRQAGSLRAYSDQVQMLADANHDLAKRVDHAQPASPVVSSLVAAGQLPVIDVWHSSAAYKPRLRFRLPWWRA